MSAAMRATSARSASSKRVDRRAPCSSAPGRRTGARTRAPPRGARATSGSSGRRLLGLLLGSSSSALELVGRVWSSGVYCGSTSTLKRTPRVPRPAATAVDGRADGRAPRRPRSPALTTSWLRSRPAQAEQRRRAEHRAPRRAEALRAAPAAACALRPGRLGGADDPDQVRERRVAQRLAARRARRRGSRRASWLRRAARSPRASGASVCTSTRPPRGAAARAARRAGRRARTCAPRRGSRGSAASRRRRARRRASTSGKSWPLATICVPTQDARAARPRSAASTRGDAALAAAASASRRNTGKRRRRAPRQLVLEPLGAGAVARDRHRAAVRAALAARARGGRSGGRRARRRAVQHERDVAVRALPDAPADAAGEEVRPAAPVEQDDRLAPGAPDVGQRLARARVQRAARVRACRRISTGGSGAAVDALGQRDALAARAQLSGRGVALPASSTAPARRGAALGDVARVVARVALLLVGGVVLLVDDDQPEVGRAARRPPSAARRRCAPRRGAGAATRRSARPAPSCECSTATRVAEARARSARRSAA